MGKEQKSYDYGRRWRRVGIRPKKVEQRSYRGKVSARKKVWQINLDVML